MVQPIRRDTAPAGDRLPRWALLGATAWLAIYVVWFYRFDLYNNPSVSRMDVWVNLPSLLLDPIDPPIPAANDPQAEQIAALRAQSGWRYLPQRFDLFLIAGLILAGAWGTGHLLLRLIRIPLPARCVDRTFFAFGAGLSALSLATLACGLAGFLSRALFVAIIAASVVIELTLRLRARRTLAVSPRPIETDSLNQRHWLALAALIPFALCYLLGAALPSTDFDANEYHLQGPKEYFQNGRVTFLPHNVYTSFPFGTEMLTLLAMALRQDWYRGALAGKVVLMCFAPLTALGLFAAGRRWFGTTAGVIAAAIYLSTPWVYRFSTIAGAEGGLSFYLFAALFAVGLLIEQQRDAKPGFLKKPVFCLLAGFFAGSAMACKYPGVLSVVIPLGLVVVLSAWSEFKTLRVPPLNFLTHLHHVWQVSWPYAIGVIIAIGPWLIKNAVETVNPVYPLLYGTFDGRDWDADLDAKWKNAHSPRAHPLCGPEDTAFSACNFAENLIDVVGRSDWHSALLFAFAPLAFLRRDTRRRVKWLWIYVGYLVLTWWLFTHRLDRFWVPLIPVVALLAGAGATWCDSNSSRITLFAWKSLAGACLFAVAIYNLAFITTPLCNFNAFLLDMTRARQIAGESVSAEIMALNAQLPSGSKALCVGDAAVFEAQFPVVYNTVFDRSILEEWCRETASDGVGEPRLRSADEIREKFAKERITHVCVNWSWILRYRTPGNYGYAPFVTPELFAELQRRGLLGQMFPEFARYREFKSLSPGERGEIEAWGQGLRAGVSGQEGVLMYQVFPVK